MDHPTAEKVDEATPGQLYKWWKGLPMSADKDKVEISHRISNRINQLTPAEHAAGQKEANW